MLVDVRAANVEEVELYSGGSAIAKRMKLRYKKAALRNLTRYRHLNVVSERLRQVCLREYIAHGIRYSLLCDSQSCRSIF